MASRSQKPGQGFTLVELTICCVIIFVLLLFLVPVFAHHGPIAHTTSEASNQKQIALAFLQYAADYDERFPPAVRYDYPIDPHTGKPDRTQGKFAQSWGPDRTLLDGRTIPGLLSMYTRSNALFTRAGTKRPRPETMLCYMYNDLLSGESQANLSQVAATVLTTNAEDRLANVGHALTPTTGPFSATFNAHDTCDPGKGATVREARTEQNGGANFAFTDAHVRWYAGGTNDPIFFPPRESASPVSIDPITGQQLGPVPGIAMTFQGREYIGTFHLR